MFESKFDVPYYGLDSSGRMKPDTLLQFLQEAAALHANSIGIGVTDLLERGMTWVLRRYRINVKKRPDRCAINIKTWFEPRRNLFSVRAFEALSPLGEVIAGAWSAWIVVDLKSGRPVRLDHALPDTYFKMAEPTGEPVTDKLPVITDGRGSEFAARRRELDMNGHVNHTVYFDWALESIPDEETDGLSPVMLDAEFLSQIKRERITVRTQKTGETPCAFSHEITAESGAVAARIATVWGYA